MMVVPLIFYYVLDERGLRWLFRYTLLAGFASGLAIFLSMVILCLQIASVQGMSLDGSSSYSKGFSERRESSVVRFGKENVRKNRRGPENTAASLTSLIQMLWIYLKGSFFDIPNYFNIQNPLLAKALLKVRYCYVILVSFVASWLLLYRKSWAACIDGRRTKGTGRLNMVFNTCSSIMVSHL